MQTEYNMVILNLQVRKYYRFSTEADSFRKAFHAFLRTNEKMIPERVAIYCKRPKSEHLQYMGIYDGGMILSSGYESISHILDCADGSKYRYTPEEFIREMIV